MWGDASKAFVRGTYTQRASASSGWRVRKEMIYRVCLKTGVFPHWLQQLYHWCLSNSRHQLGYKPTRETRSCPGHTVVKTLSVSQAGQRKKWGKLWDPTCHMHTYNSVSFSLKKEGDSHTHHDIDEPWGDRAKRKKPDTKIKILCDPT